MVTARDDFAGTTRFAVVRRIGSGGMGIVYEAVDRQGQAPVALKLLRDVDGQGIYRFKKEFRALADLHHDNLVRLGELHGEEGRWFFTMELVRGVDFLRWVRPASPGLPEVATSDAVTLVRMQPVEAVSDAAAAETRPLDEPRLRDALAQLAAGLGALHAAGKVHRDVKPSNVLVSDEGRTVLLDFGLVANLPTRTALEERSIETQAVGTLAYMAPEQATSASAVGPEADWYGVGVMLYQALTGRLPFTGSPLEVLMRKLKSAPSRPSTVAPDTPVDLEDLCLALLDPDPRRRPQEAQVLTLLGARTSSRPLPNLTSTAFVGRATELSALERALEHSRAGRPVAAFVHGESGIGKTALVRHFLERAARRDPSVLVLAGRCYEPESVPYKAFDGVVDALSRHLGRLDDGELLALRPLDVEPLLRAFPVLRRVHAWAGEVVGEDAGDRTEQRARAFRALRDLLSRLCRARALVLFIDDFQWADADSMALFADLVDIAEAPPLLLLATVRETAAPAAGGSPSPSAWTERAGARGLRSSTVDLRTLYLAPLPPIDARALAEELGRHLVLPEEALATIARESEGHPLFVHELVLHAAAVPDARTRAAPLESALAERISQLEPPAQRLLAVLAVAGTPLRIDVLAEAASLTATDAAAQLARLRAAQLVQARGQPGAEEVEPQHDRIRVAALRRLDDVALREHHLHLADALEARRGDPAQLVRHLLAAGDSRRAGHHAEIAARVAAEALAFDQAAELLHIALAGSRLPAEQRALRMRLGRALIDAGRGRDAAAALLEAARGADPSTRLECRREAAQQLICTGHVNEGLATLSEVLAEIGERLPETPARALLSLLASRAELKVRGVGWTAAPPEALQPQELMRVDVFRTVGLALGLVDTVRGAAFQSRGLLLALRTGEPRRIGRALVFEALYFGAQGVQSFARARALLAEAGRILRDTDDSYLRFMVPGAEGMLRVFAGDFVSAADRIARAQELFTGEQYGGVRFELHNGRVFHLLALRHLGRIREARRHLDEYLREADRRGDLYLQTMLTAQLNAIWLAGGQVDTAERLLGQRPWKAPAESFHVAHWSELMARTEIALYRGAGAQARDDLAGTFRALRRSLLLRLVPIRTVYLWLRGRLALTDAIGGVDRERALGEVTRCADRLRAEGLASAAAWACMLDAGVAAQRSDVVTSVTALSDAIRRFDVLEMRLYAALARTRLAALGDDQAKKQAAAYLAEEGIADPERMAQVYAPFALR